MKVVTLKNRVQLVHACAIVKKKYVKMVQDPENSSLYNNVSFREHGYLVMLFDISYVSSQKC